MQFTHETLRQFFSFFSKNLSTEEINLLLTGKGKWTETKATQIQLNLINKYCWVFKFIPGLIAVFFCNTTAFRSANHQSDIDLFIVSENGQIWICRIFTTLILHILGIRRHGKKITNRFCLSFFASETGALALQDLQIKDQADFYLAIWTATLSPIAVKNDFLDQFELSNNWIKNYGLQFINLNNYYILSIFNQKIGNFCQKIGLEICLKKLFLSRSIKKFKLLKNQQGTIISDHYLKFHDNDIREQVQKKINNF